MKISTHDKTRHFHIVHGTVLKYIDVFFLISYSWLIYIVVVAAPGQDLLSTTRQFNNSSTQKRTVPGIGLIRDISTL